MINRLHKAINQSLVAKNAIVFFALLLFTVLLTGYLVFKINSKNVIQASQTQMSHQTEILSLKSSSYFESIIGDIKYLSSCPPLMEYINAFEPDHFNKVLANRIKDEFKALIQSKQDYVQIRLISARLDGKEIIRIDKSGERISVTAQDELQIKGHRDYYLNTIALSPGDIYFSDINLNREYGEISKPEMPTLRAAAPLFQSNGSLFGIIVINLDLRRHFAELMTLCDDKFDLILVNHNYQYLISTQAPQQSFGFDRGNDYRLNRDFHFSSSQIEDLTSRLQKVKDQQDEMMFFKFKAIDYPRDDYHLYVGTAIKEAQILLPVRKARNASFLITFLTSIVATVIMLYIIRRQTKDLKTVTNSIVKFSSDNKSYDLTEVRQDEIGVLIKAFNKMAKKVNRQINELAIARETAESAFKEKEAFLENISHEIRNPLHLILGLTKLLLEDQSYQDRKSALHTLKISANNLLSLVNDVLDLKKIKAGLITIDPGFFSPSNLLNEVYESFKAEAGKKHINLELNLDPGLQDIQCFGDKMRISQILVNLMSNAVKFTPDNGRISMECKILSQAREKASLAFKITDTGIGIKADDLQTIQKRFERKSDIQTEGSGLGLPIVINLLELMNSTLEVESEYQSGSTFSFILDMDVEKISKNKSVEKSYYWTIPRDVALLVIEDDKQNIFLLKHILAHRFEQVSFISSKEELSSLDQTFELIITDLQIGDSLITEYHELIQRCKTQQTKIIILSAHSQDKLVDSLKGFTYDYYLSKPVDMERLLMEICFQTGRNRWETPQLSKLKSDYDHDPQKVEQVLSLMTQEFKNYKEQMLNAIKHDQREIFGSVVHKAIVHFKNLKLDSLIELVQLIKDNWEPLEHSKKNNYSNQIAELFDFYIAFMIKQSEQRALNQV